MQSVSPGRKRDRLAFERELQRAGENERDLLVRVVVLGYLHAFFRKNRATVTLSVFTN